MNQIQQIQRINQQELDSGATASWHDQYKNSAYINVGGLPFNLTEGDVLAIFSQYGEILDINLPRDKTTGKVRGFAWLMYSDQRSTILAVDNLNGATILGRMIRVDHTLNYKQLEHDQETGKMKERETESFAADPRNFIKKGAEEGDSDAESEVSLPPNFDPEDPMAEYILSQHRASKKRRIEGGEGSSSKEKEEKRRRKEERRLKREEREKKKASGSGGSRRKEIEGRERDRDGTSRGRYDDEERGTRRGSQRDRSRSPRHDDERRRNRNDDYDRDRSRDDRYSRDDRRRNDERDERDRGDRRSRREDDDRRDSRGPVRGSAFSDLEKWARG